MTVSILRASARAVRRGVSLVETLVAFSALTVGLLGLLTLIDNARVINARHSDQLRAVALARSRLAVLRAAGYEAVVDDADSTSPTLPLRRARPVPEDPRYVWTLEAPPMEAAIPARRLTIAIFRDVGAAEESEASPAPETALFRLSGFLLNHDGRQGEAR